jgi:hypothetical protein
VRKGERCGRSVGKLLLTYRQVMDWLKTFICELQQQARFAYSCISYDNIPAQRNKKVELLTNDPR